LKDATVGAALDAAKRNEAQAIDQEIRVCEIPAPPFHEEVRGHELKRLFDALGLKDVRIDRVGNVVGVRPGKAPHPNVVLARISHQLSAAARDRAVSTSLRLVTVLDILSKYASAR
jgi:hypothetical protein